MREEGDDDGTIMHPEEGLNVSCSESCVHSSDRESLQDDGQTKVQADKDERETVVSQKTEQTACPENASAEEENHEDDKRQNQTQVLDRVDGQSANG